MPQTSPQNVIAPGSTIGMVGGGQLGRMFAVAAITMGYRVIVFCQHDDEPAAQVATDCVCGRLDNHEVVKRFAAKCDVITLEFENIPADTIALCSSYAPTYPSSDLLATAQDRLREKQTFHDAGLPVTPFCKVASTDELVAAGNKFGWPVIVKTATSGYDGKGQHRINEAAEADRVQWETADSWIAEKCIAFDREISVIVARTPDGRTATYPLFENDHTNHILDVTTIPAVASDQLSTAARQIATKVSEALDLVGILCVEMFVDGESLMINEVAPRPHNSGHVTIEACHTSQYQQHVRAICNLPLGDTSMHCGGAAMVNLLGDLWDRDGTPPDWSAALDCPGTNLHLYGKADAKIGRKMGHLTVTADTKESAKQTAQKAKSSL